MSRAGCERFRELAGEVALGIADGEERASALEHVAECPTCRARLERLSALADELLLVAPAIEPPAGFETRVTAGIAPPRRRREPLWRRMRIPVAAAAAAAAVAAGAVWLALGDDRSLADSYREALAVAHGEYFEASPIEAPGGKPVGYAYGYQGDTSWILAVVKWELPPGTYRIEVVTKEGHRLPLRHLRVGTDEGSAGGVTPVPFDSIAELRLLDGDGHEVGDAELHD